MERTGIDPTEHSLPLAEIIKNYGKLTIAVSGGVDSMTLGSFAHRLLHRPSGTRGDIGDNSLVL